MNWWQRFLSLLRGQGFKSPTNAGSSPESTGERLAGLVPAGRGATLNKQAQGSGTNALAAPALLGGRQTLPTNYNPFGLSGYTFVYRREYQDLDLANVNIGDYEAVELLELLADLSPDVSRAVWNNLRIAGTDLKFQVVNKADEDDIKGQAIADAMVASINKSAGGIRNLIVQMIMTAFLQGAVCLDVAPTEDLSGVEDFFPVNPVTIHFIRDDDQNPVPFQRQPLFWGSVIAPYRRMNTDLFFYTPIDPYVDDVYGRPPAAPVLQIIFFQIQVLQDLKRVIHQQGWPKIDIAIITEIMMMHIPADVKMDPDQTQRWLDARVREITSAYNSMSPEDAYVHPDYVTVSSDAAKAGNGLFNVQGLLETIRVQVISALKQLPTLMGGGAAAGSTETFSTVELSIYAHSIDNFRIPVGEMLAKAVEVGLQLSGYSAKVKPVWADIEVLSRMGRALADAQEAGNQAYYLAMGWITQDQAAKKVTGSNAVEAVPPLWSMEPASAAQMPKPNDGPIAPHIKNSNSKPI